MNDATSELQSPETASTEITPTKRGRKPETPAQRIERFKIGLAQAKVAARDAERRRHAIVGEAMLAEADADPQLKARVRDSLRRRVSGHQARADIASLLRD